ncbi:hypothetical protein FRC05_001106 [Tulasnella sp. 425]|nr:hypothetical protein FRC05_001106 [Tulasnella sp. 425]
MLSSPALSLELLDAQGIDLHAIQSTVSTYLLRVSIVNSLRLATFTFVVYDILVTLDREIFYVWKSRWSFAKSVFLINRYVPPVVLAFQVIRTVMPYPSPKPQILLCSLGGILLGLLDLVIILVTSSVSTIRVWAIYQRNTKVLIFLIISFLACFGPPIVITSSAKLLSHDSNSQRDAELLKSVKTYISLVSSVDPAAVPWQLERCFVGSLPIKYMSTIIGTLVYESALLSATIAGFDSKNPISQAYVGSMYFVAVKATLCSHIILRLRSYFAEDPIVDGTTMAGDAAYELGRPASSTVEVSATRSSRAPLPEVEWTDGPDPKSVHRSRLDDGGVATAYPSSNDVRRSITEGSTSWLRFSGTPEGGTSLAIMESSDKIPTDLEMDDFTSEPSRRDALRRV